MRLSGAACSLIPFLSSRSEGFFMLGAPNAKVSRVARLSTAVMGVADDQAGVAGAQPMRAESEGSPLSIPIIKRRSRRRDAQPAEKLLPRSLKAMA